MIRHLALFLALGVAAVPLAAAQPSAHSADTDGNCAIALPELLRVIQFFNAGGYACGDVPSIDGYRAGAGPLDTCARHDADFAAPFGQISLQELLRVIQFFNSGGYRCEDSGGSLDGFAAGTGALGCVCGAGGEGEGTPEGASEGSVEGFTEGAPEGRVEGFEEGVVEGAGEGLGEGVGEGSVEGLLEGTAEGVSEGVLEGSAEGLEEGLAEGVSEGLVEGAEEGTGEGLAEGTNEGVVEGATEGTAEGVVEGSTEGEDPTPPFVESIELFWTDDIPVSSISAVVTFSEPVSGVDLEDFTTTSVLDVVTPPPTGLFFEALSTSATLQIQELPCCVPSFDVALIDDDSIVNAAGVPLGGVGAGNGNAVSAQGFPGLCPPEVCSPEGEPEGSAEGVVEGAPEGEGASEGTPEPEPVYAIGQTALTFQDAARSNRSIPVTVYYPAETAGTNVPVYPPSDRAFPVVVFGHGFTIGIGNYGYIWQALVPAGYIVALVNTETGLLPNHTNFGRDLAYTVDALQAENLNAGARFFGRVAPRSAVMGHSMGGGATFLSAQYSGNIDTVVGLAPAETNPKASDAASSITLPSLILAASKDCVTPIPQHAGLIYGALDSTCKRFVDILRGSHCQFAQDSLTCGFGEIICTDRDWIAAGAQQALSMALVRAWFDEHLKQLPGARVELEARLAAETTNGIVSATKVCPAP